jgi:hypothetical protein
MHVSMSRTGIDLPVPERPYHFVISADQLLVVLVKEDQRHRVREREWPSRPMGWGERALGRLHLHATTCSTAGAEDTGTVRGGIGTCTTATVTVAGRATVNEATFFVPGPKPIGA